MGTNHSVQVAEEREEEEEEEEEEDEDEDEDDGDDNEGQARVALDNYLVKKVLEQEPEMLPCHASASPLSPQLSSLGTPRLGPSIKVWDPYNVLAPSPPLPPPPVLSRSFSSNVIDDDRVVMEVFLISHGECELNLRPDLISGRCPEAGLTLNGKRQARALSVFLKSQGVLFNGVYSSPLARARSMAVSVCQEMSISDDQIQTSDSLTEISQGDWEGCLRSEIYTAETMSFIDRLQPDFAPPTGETFRQVEFRMVQFLVRIVLELSEKSSSDFTTHHQSFVSHALSNSVQNRELPSFPSPPPQWDRHRHGFSRKKFSKSRLQYVTKTGENDVEVETSPQDMSGRGSASITTPCIGVFTHSVPIKCLLTGLLGCSPLAMHKFIIEDSSVTVLQHSSKTGWQIKRSNDMSHLRLL